MNMNFSNLKQTLIYTYKNCRYFKEKLDSTNINLDLINSFEDFKNLPYTTKNDFSNNYPFGMFAVDSKKIVRFHSSSGSKGIPTLVGYTKNDLLLWKKCILEIINSAQLSSNDIIQNCFSFGMFTGALGFEFALEDLELTLIPTGSGNTLDQLKFMKDLKTTAFISTPSYALYLAETAINNNISIRDDLNISKILVGSELLTPSFRNILQNLWGKNTIITQNYGLSEVMGPGVAGECIYNTGMHISKYFYPEIIDPITKKILPLGSTGELVLTTLFKEALPLIRYRTNDIVTLNYTKCKCGKECYTISNILGRTDDMIKLKGVKVFQSQIEKIILSNDFCTNNYEILLTNDHYLDNVTINIELPQNLILSVNKKKELEKKLQIDLKNDLKLTVNINLLNFMSLKRSNNKIKKFFDLRKK